MDIEKILRCRRKLKRVQKTLLVEEKELLNELKKIEIE